MPSPSEIFKPIQSVADIGGIPQDFVALRDPATTSGVGLRLCRCRRQQVTAPGTRSAVRTRQDGVKVPGSVRSVTSGASSNAAVSTIRTCGPPVVGPWLSASA